MLKAFIKMIKDSFQIKESFFICEETKFHAVVNEVTNNFMVIHVTKMKNVKIREEIVYSDLKTVEEAEKYLKAYKEALKKKRSVGIVLVKENSE